MSSSITTVIGNHCLAVSEDYLRLGNTQRNIGRDSQGRVVLASVICRSGSTPLHQSLGTGLCSWLLPTTPNINAPLYTLARLFVYDFVCWSLSLRCTETRDKDFERLTATPSSLASMDAGGNHPFMRRQSNKVSTYTCDSRRSSLAPLLPFITCSISSQSGCRETLALWPLPIGTTRLTACLVTRTTTTSTLPNADA